jgi:hypothetical protein
MNLVRAVRFSLPMAILGACLATAAAQNVSMDALRTGCADDAARFCSNVPTGGGRVIACLKQHQNEVSNKCRAAAGLPPRPDGGTSPAQPAGGAPTAGAAAGAPTAAVPAMAAVDSHAAAVPAGAPIGKPMHVAGETYVRRVITDPAHDNMDAATLHVPETWKLESKVEWHYNWTEYPLSFSVHAASPDNSEAFTLYPVLRMEWTEVAPQYRQYVKEPQPTVGVRGGMGAITMPLQPPMQGMETFIKSVLPNVTNLKWIGQQDLPGLEKALGIVPFEGDHGIAIKVSYDLNGKPMEEAFFGVYYASKGGNQAVNVSQFKGAANVVTETTWGFRGLQSFRAPAGRLDARMAVFCLIAKSLVYSPQWLELGKKIDQQMLVTFNQNLQHGYDQLRAAAATMQQMQAQEKAMDAQVAKFDTALRAPGYDDGWLRATGGGGSSGGGRSGTDQFDQNIRGVDRVHDDTTGGTIELTNAGQYHFTDGFGNYRTSDDPNYTPEKNGEVGSWTAMPPQ